MVNKLVLFYARSTSVRRVCHENIAFLEVLAVHIHLVLDSTEGRISKSLALV